MKIFKLCFIVIFSAMAVNTVQASLVAYWAMDEGAGQTVSDKSNQNNHGILGDSTAVEAEDPKWVSDPVMGNVLEWTGSDSSPQWINLTANLAAFKNLSQGSITAWIKIPGGDAVDVILAASDSGDASSELRFFYESGLRFDIREQDADPADENGQIVSDINVADNQWHFVAVTVDSSNNAKIYVDGQLAGTGKEPFFSAVSDLDHMSLGRNIDSSGTQWVFKGRMCKVAVFDNAVSPDVIEAIYNGVDILDIGKLAVGPEPADNAGHVSLSSVLSWQKPDEIENPQYNLYFGTDDSFPGGPVLSGSSETSYTPPAMNPATTYFWRVDVIDNGTVHQGSVWSFTTAGYADNPVPPDGQTGVYTETSLSWTGDSTVSTYNIYLAKAGETLKLIDTVSTPYYDSAGDFMPSTEYHWRIDTRDSNGNVIKTGTVWTFTTAADGTFFDEVDVFVNNTEGYTCYRIPAVIVAPNGDVLAFCEGRKNNCGDHGDVDIVMKRSTDGGATWQPLQLVYEEGGTANITIGNPCPVVDHSNGRIWLPFCRDNARVFVGYSDDNGHTWSERREITSSVKPPEWGWYATGPGVGIQLENEPYRGRLVIPCDHDYGQKGSHMIYSDDHGQTWTYSQRILPGCNECQVVELIDGRLMNNARTYSIDPDHRGISISTDGGATWSEVWFDEELPEPTCQASFLRFTRADKQDKNRLIFSNPAHTSSRVNMTVKMSYDEGETWPVAKQIYAGSSAYSCLTVLPNWHIGCLYEKDNYSKIVFARFSVEWLTDGKDSLNFCRKKIEGDINHDCKVNLADLAIILKNWMKCFLVPSKACP